LLVVDEHRNETDTHHDGNESGLVLSEFVGLPVVVSEGMLHDSPEVLPPSLLVTSIGELFTSSELFKFPIVLSTDGSIDHFESFSLVGDVIVQIMLTMGSALDPIIGRRVISQPEIIGLHPVLSLRHGV